MAHAELEARQSAMWGSGPFELVEETIADMHDDLVARLGVDLAPALVETAKRCAAERGLQIDCEAGDVENLRLDDASFDVVSSSVGAIFAPDRGEELHRACVGLIEGDRVGEKIRQERLYTVILGRRK